MKVERNQKMTQQNQMIFLTPQVSVTPVTQDPSQAVDDTKTLPMIEAAFSQVDSKIQKSQISRPTEVQIQILAQTSKF